MRFASGAVGPRFMEVKAMSTQSILRQVAYVEPEDADDASQAEREVDDLLRRVHGERLHDNPLVAEIAAAARIVLVERFQVEAL